MSPVILDIYYEAFTNAFSLILFCLFYYFLFGLSNHWAWKQFQQFTANRRSYFAETFLSFIHAVITSFTCCLQLYFNTKFTRTLYSYSAITSCAYFVYHGFNYLSFRVSYHYIYIFHHILGFLSIVPITNLNGYYLQDTECSNVVYFVSAGVHLVEISTMWLDIRIFTSMLQKRKSFFMSTLFLVASYIPIRCVWLGYLIGYIWQSHTAFDSCFGNASLYVLLSAVGFFWTLSLGYVISMIKSGTKFFKLAHYKDC